MAFEGLLGQNDIKKMLSELSANEKIGHAYLFTGAPGIGKKSFANEFARMCTCTSKLPDGSACGKCRACTLESAGTNPDIIRIAVKDDKKEITVEQVREGIREQILKAPLFSAKKVFIVDEAEKMNEQAQNALLKTLEEPPEFVTILLLASNISLIVDTVKSRSVRVDLIRNTDGEIWEKAEKTADAEKINRALLCSYADGIMGCVEEFVGNRGISEMRRNIAGLLGPVFEGKSDAKAALLQLIDIKNKKYDFFFFQMLSFLRDALVLARTGSKAQILNGDFRKELTELGREAGYTRLSGAIETVNSCYVKLIQNGMAELTVADMLNKISS